MAIGGILNVNAIVEKQYFSNLNMENAGSVFSQKKSSSLKNFSGRK